MASRFPRTPHQALHLLRTAGQTTVATFARTPPFSHVVRAGFERWTGICWGVFDTFAEASEAAPKSKPLGYDNPLAAGMYSHVIEHLEPKDYAVAFWLLRRLRPGDRVLDFGGHVGIKYYAIGKVLPYPEDIEWIVYDVPAVVTAGRRLAEEMQASSLTFVDALTDAPAADIFLGLGSLQYVETPFPDLLRGLSSLPRYVILSSIPMTSGRRYVTLQNIGTAYCPYLIENRTAVVQGMEALGYELVHSWKNPEKACKILDFPERSVYGYTSMHFARQ